jgi:hypothetical protein
MRSALSSSANERKKIMEFNIGERVRIRRYEDMPDSVKHKGIAKNSGNDGEIVDKLWSAARDCMVYRIQFDDNSRVSKTDFDEGTFDRIEDLMEVTYAHEFEYLDNVVIGIFYEVDQDGNKTEIARGHGHIIHEGALGIAQASAYALKKLYEKMNGGKV